MKKISILGICLLILAGIVVVLFRGFNVNFLLEQHEVIEFNIGKDFELSDVKNILDNSSSLNLVIIHQLYHKNVYYKTH